MTPRGIFFFALFTRKLRERESWRKSRGLIDAMEIATRTKGEEGGEGAIRSSVFSFTLETSKLFIASYLECTKYCSNISPVMTPRELARLPRIYPSLEYPGMGKKIFARLLR